MSINGQRIKIENDGDTRKDPTSFLPDEPMTYELKKKKKKKKKVREDPLGEASSDMKYHTEITLDPEVNIKVENIEVELDFNDFANHNGLMVEGPQSEESQEPVVKLEEENKEAVLLTFESVINEHHQDAQGDLSTPFRYSQGANSEPPGHICKVCHLIFQTTNTLKMHQKRKHKIFRRSFKHVCDNCGMSYERRNSLAAHIRRKHGPNSSDENATEQTCEVCSLVFKGMARLRMHMRRIHGSFVDSFKHICKDCGLTYDKYRSLVVHIKRKHSKIQKPVVEQWYNCPFCPKIYGKRETYARHLQRHHNKVSDDDNEADSQLMDEKNEATGDLTCKECPLVFASISYLKLHMRRKHNALKEDFKLKCKICNLSYNKIESLKRHIRRKHDDRSFCDVCNKQFDTYEQYLNHSHMKVARECSLCGLIFASQGGLAKHIRCTHKIDSPKTVFCHICNEGFHTKRQLKPHMLKVHLKVSYTCKLCKKVFRAKESYKRHIIFKHASSNSTDVKQFQQCEQCDETFPDEFELCRHIDTCHSKVTVKTENACPIKKEDDIKDIFQCTKCPKSCLTWEELKNHFEHTHHAETQCQVCGQIVPANELAKHIKTNHTDTLIKCKYCEFETKIRKSMTQHMLRHKNATTINCGFPGCRYKTYYEEAMNKHKEKHDQVVKFQCTQCTFQTMNKYILKYHEEAHVTGRKKYACNQCDYATTLPANLVQHKYKHSAEKRFKCEVCPFASKYNTSLRFHVKKKHCDLPTST